MLDEPLQLQAVALHEGLRCKKRLWREAGREQLVGFRLATWASRRDLLELLDRLNPTIAELSMAIAQEAEKCIEVQRLKTHPWVGPRTALPFVLIGEEWSVPVRQAPKSVGSMNSHVAWCDCTHRPT